MAKEKTLRERAIFWWNNLGDNFLMKTLVQGELTTKHHGEFRRVGSLTGREIEEIYKQEVSEE